MSRKSELCKSDPDTDPDTEGYGEIGIHSPEEVIEYENEDV
jgi:hypothetical protein